MKPVNAEATLWCKRAWACPDGLAWWVKRRLMFMIESEPQDMAVFP